MPSYNRFIELQQQAILLLKAVAKPPGSSSCNGISYSDSFSLAVSHIKSVSSHRVFKGLTARGKTSVGWFFGFKLHLVISSEGEVIDFTLTPGNVSDNTTHFLEKLLKSVHGKVFGDKSYLINRDFLKNFISRGYIW